MSNDDYGNAPSIEHFTRRSVRAYWEDGLWDLACVGIFALLGAWGAVYVRFVAFPASTRSYLQEIGRDGVWIGLAFLILVLAVYVHFAWQAVRKLKRVLIYPIAGRAEHRFFLPVDRRVFIGYFVLYILGLGFLYILLKLTKGGYSVMSVPFIISPAAISLVVGKIYNLRRYQWIAVVGFVIAVVLELFVTTPANMLVGPRNFLDVLPQWGSPALPCIVWAIMFAISGLVGLISVRRNGYAGG